MDANSDHAAPIHGALIRPMLIAGIPRDLALVVWTTTLALVFGMHEVWAAPIGILLHIAAAMITRIDPYFMSVLRNELWTPRSLDP